MGNGSSKLSGPLKESSKKALKRLIKQLGGKKKLQKLVLKTAALAATDPKKAIKKLVKRLGGADAIRKAIKDAALAGAGAAVAGTVSSAKKAKKAARNKDTGDYVSAPGNDG